MGLSLVPKQVEVHKKKLMIEKICRNRAQRILITIICLQYNVIYLISIKNLLSRLNHKETAFHEKN